MKTILLISVMALSLFLTTGCGDSVTAPDPGKIGAPPPKDFFATSGDRKVNEAAGEKSKRMRSPVAPSLPPD